MKSTGAERDIVRNFVSARIETGNFTRGGGNEILGMLRVEGRDPPILPTTPPPKPPTGGAELDVAARIAALATECQAAGMTAARLQELFAFVLADTR